MKKKTKAWGMMTLRADGKEKVSEIFEHLKTHLMQSSHKDYSFKFDENLYFFEEEKWYTLTAYFEGCGEKTLHSYLKESGKYCNHDSAIESKEWETKFEFTEDSKEYDLLCRETAYFYHRSGEDLEKLELVETLKQSFCRNAYTLSHFTDYPEKEIANALGLGKKYENSKNYELHREQCLRKAVASYKVMNNTKLTVEEAEKNLIKMFPFLQKEKVNTYQN